MNSIAIAWRRSRLAAIALAAPLVLAGCSADVSRFDFPIIGLNGDASAPTATVPGAPAYEGAPATPRASSRSPIIRRPVRTARLPKVAPPISGSGAPYAAPAPSGAATGLGARGVPIARGRRTTIRVARGDTLYRLSVRYKVAVKAIMAANGMTSPSIREGQRLVIPAASSVGRVATTSPSAVRPVAPTATYRKPADVTPVLASDVSHTVAAGDSLYRISRRYGVKHGDLAALNGIDDPTKLKPGMVLRIPAVGAAAGASGRRVAALGASGGSARVPVTSPSRPAISPAISKVPPVEGIAVTAPPKALKAPAVKSKPRRVARLPEPSLVGAKRFRWPARGRILSIFGTKSDGSHNDGINVAVPAGTPIKAAENGVVAYAGSELKGYGKLVLIRHADNWVSAYAHSSAILVKRGDRVRRGQIIARAGKTGNVDRPQLHFELRKGARPVDPMKYMVN